MAKRKGKGGRKPVEPEEKVIQVNFYTKTKYVQSIGGMDRAREFVKNQLETFEGY